MLVISVIIPTYNRKSVIPRAIESVFKQTYTNWELIVVDDASTDGSLDLLVEMQKVFRPFTVLNTSEIAAPYVTTVSGGKIRNKAANIPTQSTEALGTENNRGVSAARNLGMANSRGEWLAFLDSDDEWLPKKLEWSLKMVTDNPTLNLKVVHGDEIWIRNGIRVNQMKKHQKYGGWIFEKCLPLCLISPSAVMIHRSVFEQVGNFREDYPVCEDYELWLRITARYQIGFIDRPIIKKYGGHEDQLSHKFVAMDYWRIKALNQLLWDNKHIYPSFLTTEQISRIAKEIEKRGKWLLKGYQKHQNLLYYKEIEEILDNSTEYLFT